MHQSRELDALLTNEEAHFKLTLKGIQLQWQ